MVKQRDNVLESKESKNWGYLLLLLSLGAQTMIVELTIPRLLAPTFGNTLFCWTAIIAVVLIALALGYSLGGRLAARKNARELIWILGAFCSFWVVGLSFVGQAITMSLAKLGLMYGPLVAAAILAALPAGCSAAVVPLVVQTRPESAAKSAGQCYAWSTVGSVGGVLLTGYVLLPFLGISGAMLVGSGVVFAIILMNWQRLVGVAGILAVILGGFASSSHDEYVLLDKSNGYHRIQVKTYPDRPNLRALFLDSTPEGVVELGSSYPVMEYQRQISHIAQAVPEISHAFFIGGGSFSMPRHLKTISPEAVIDVVEIDPDVVKAAKEFLELSEECNVFIGDGRQVLRQQSVLYDLIVNDAFHGVRKIPFHLVTREFLRVVRNKLTPKGLYAVNALGHPVNSQLVRSVLQTVMGEFEHVSLLYDARDEKQNMWILASQSPISQGQPPPANETKGRLLTDNNAPVEFLIAADLVQQF